MSESKGGRRALRIEAALWIVMATLAFLAKDNPRLEYPRALALFAALLASSLGTSFAVRRAPERSWLHALLLLAGFGAIAALQQDSGGAESNLWVLYLLPAFTCAILLGGRETLLVAGGACASNAAFYAVAPASWGAVAAFELALKTGVLAIAAGATWTLSRSERDAESRVRSQREEIERLERSLGETREAREKELGAATIALDGAGILHDLSSPLMVVRGYAAYHLSRGTGDAELEHDLARIDAAASFCQDLAARLVRRDEEPLARQSARAIAEYASSLAEPTLSSRGVRLALELAPEPLELRAPQRALERILINLLVNAGRATPAGRLVTLSLGRREQDGRGWAEFEVSDEGCGLGPDILARLFQPFATTRAGNGGTGLGLYLSRERARRLGGELSAENRPQGGARFVLRLPLAGRGAPVAA